MRAVRQRVSFRSVKEAVEAARDGDHILLLQGIHNGMGCALVPVQNLAGARTPAGVIAAHSLPSHYALLPGVCYRPSVITSSVFQKH